MDALWIAIGITAAVTALIFIIGLIAVYFVFFFSPPFDRENPEPDALMGEEFPECVKKTDRETAKIKETYPHEAVSVKSDDGLNLYADFYINQNETCRTVICVHGYNSCGYHDFSRMVEPILKNGCNCLLIDQRHHGKSEGRFTGYGMLESRDLLKWISLVNEYFPDGKIVLYGVSMGAATVMQASGLDLPGTVKGIAEDCGYTSCYNEFAAVLKKIAHLPAFPLMNILAFMSRLLLKLDIRSDSRDCVAKSPVPMLFLHGDADAFIPVSMCGECFEACGSEKYMHIYEGAGHAQSHFRKPEEYERDFFDFVGKVM